MTARTSTPRDVADRLVEAELKALAAALRRHRNHARIAWSLGGAAWPVVDWTEPLQRAVDRIAWIEHGATEGHDQ